MQEAAATMTEAEPSTGLPAKFWNWKGYNIRYQSAGEENTGGLLATVHTFSLRFRY